MLPLHPSNEAFRMMTDEELKDLAESIKAEGLLMPIVLDKNGAVLDGKCRLRACELAGVKPRFETFEGDEDQCADFIWSMNALRCHLSPSQRAMGQAIVAKMMEAREAKSDCYWEHRVLPEARAVAQYPDLADRVMAGTLSLAEAYEEVLGREREAERAHAEAEEHRRLLEELRQTHGLLAIQVDEGALTLDEALAASRVPVLAEHAEAIRSLGKRIVADAIEIGRRLADCKALLGHGNWLPWLDREFQWSESTALNFMRLHELSLKSVNVADLGLPASALYLLAAPSTPEAVRDDVLARAGAGEAFSRVDVRRLIDEVRPNGPTRDRYQKLRDLIAQMSRDQPDDPLIEQMRTLLL
jgi:hypothetical protein